MRKLQTRYTSGKCEEKQHGKRKKILRQLKIKAENQLKSSESLVNVKEKWVESLRMLKVKLIKTRTRDARIRNNQMFEEDEVNFYRNTADKKKYKGTVPNIDRFVTFWGGIWEDVTKTPKRKWMQTVANKIKDKVTQVEEMTVEMGKLQHILKKRKNWSESGIDGIQNAWWKKLTNTWRPLTNAMNCWIDRPELIPTWITHGRTVLIPKSEELSDEKNYLLITCSNTSYKIFTGLLDKHMKDHADRNEKCDKSQLGTFSGVLGTVDQLLIDNAIMDEVRENKRNLAVSLYDYRKVYDMVRHDWMIRVFRWMGYSSKLINVLKQLMVEWKTKLEVDRSGY